MTNTIGCGHWQQGLGPCVCGEPANHQPGGKFAPLALAPEPVLHIQPHPTINGIAAEVEITGLAIKWQVMVLPMGGEQHTMYLAHTTPDNGWSSLLRQRDYADMGHPIPTTIADLIRWCRWFFEVKRREG